MWNFRHQLKQINKNLTPKYHDYKGMSRTWVHTGYILYNVELNKVNFIHKFHIFIKKKYICIKNMCLITSLKKVIKEHGYDHMRLF